MAVLHRPGHSLTVSIIDVHPGRRDAGHSMGQTGLRPASRPATTGTLAGAGGKGEGKEPTRPKAVKGKQKTA